MTLVQCQDSRVRFAWSPTMGNVLARFKVSVLYAFVRNILRGENTKLVKRISRKNIKTELAQF